MPLQRPSLAFIWALFSTLTGALSTVVYLLLAHRQPWASEFIQLYSTLGMVAGWLNALIYFLAPRSIALQSRKAALAFFMAAYCLASWIYRHAFHHELAGLRELFMAVNLIPVLYANAFGIEFYEGNYPWPYKRTVAFNLLLFMGGAGAYIFRRTESGLYSWTLLAGIPFIIIWMVDRWNRIDVPSQRSRLLQPILNPSLPVLERTLLDQLVLSRLEILSWSLPIFLLGRIVTFTGNVVYSYLLGTNSRVHRAQRRESGRWIWIIMLFAAGAAVGAMRYPWSAFFVGQIFAWLVTALLSAEYDSSSRIYPKLLLIWLFDLAIRSVGILVSRDLRDYLPFLVFSSLANLILVLALRQKWRAIVPRERTNTKFRPEDFPSIR